MEISGKHIWKIKKKFNLETIPCIYFLEISLNNGITISGYIEEEDYDNYLISVCTRDPEAKLVLMRVA